MFQHPRTGVPRQPDLGVSRYTDHGNDQYNKEGLGVLIHNASCYRQKFRELFEDLLSLNSGIGDVFVYI